MVEDVIIMEMAWTMLMTWRTLTTNHRRENSAGANCADGSGVDTTRDEGWLEPGCEENVLDSEQEDYESGGECLLSTGSDISEIAEIPVGALQGNFYRTSASPSTFAIDIFHHCNNDDLSE